jgi:hypothetical protein
LESVVFGQDQQTAEEMFFANLPEPEKGQIPALSEWEQRAKPQLDHHWQGQGLGIFDYGGR